MRWVPAGLIVFLTCLALIGQNLRAFEMPSATRCNYVLSELDVPAADVLLIGGSRVMRGLDPDFIETQLAEGGTDATVDRLSLTFARFSQFYPLLNSYVENRGAPNIAYLQLSYIFKPFRLELQDLPLNNLRNMAFGTMSDMAAVQQGAPYNDLGGVIPRRFHKRSRSLSASWLNKLELSIFSALRYVPKRIRGDMPECTGNFLRSNGNRLAAMGLTPADGETFALPDATDYAKWSSEAEGFLRLAPGEPWRQGETAQLGLLVDLLQDAGTEVVFLIMPSVDQRTVDAETRADFAAIFPDIEIEFPMDAYDGELAEQISVSFVDTHHVNSFGAVHLSNALAVDLQQRLSAP